MDFSRREFMAILAGGCGAALACAGGGLGLGGLAYFLSQQKDERPVVVVTSTPPGQAVVVTPNEASAPLIVARADWGALAPNHEADNEQGFYSPDNPLGWRVYDTDLKQIYTTLVLHHSVIDEGDDIESLLEIQNLHRNDRKWADVGYHYLIGKDGTIYEGRPINVRGAHVAGYNTGSAGVCFIGNFMENLPTDPQIDSGHKLIAWLAEALNLSHLAAHRAFNTDTLCPGDNFMPYFEEFAFRHTLTIGTEGYLAPTPTPSANLCCCCHV